MKYRYSGFVFFLLTIYMSQEVFHLKYPSSKRWAKNVKEKLVEYVRPPAAARASSYYYYKKPTGDKCKKFNNVL